MQYYERKGQLNTEVKQQVSQKGKQDAPQVDYRRLNARILNTWREQEQQAQIYLH